MVTHPRRAEDRLYLGLISGTSIDAADAALIDFADPCNPRRVAAAAVAPDHRLWRELLALSQPDKYISLAEFGELNQRVGHWLAEAAFASMRKAGCQAQEIAAIGSHGQTVYHEPAGRYAFSLQIGSPSVLAARLGAPVVADFRSSDIAVGGQGAPLVCAFHRELFAHPHRHRAVLNIGGIANVTVLPATGDRDEPEVTGFDTGPGNALMDAWINLHHGADFDRDGRWAAQGTPGETLLALMLADRYFSRPAPKSTGREYFNLAWLRARLDRLAQPPAPAEVQATLCELTARSAAAAIRASAPQTEEVLVCGGGAANARLCERLAALIAPAKLLDTGTYGVDPDHVESTAFAWLARQTVHGRAGNLPRVTGARAPAPLGAIYQPPLPSE